MRLLNDSVALANAVRSTAADLCKMNYSNVKGGGFSLLEAFDFALAVPGATFSIPEMNAGIAPMISIMSMRNHVTRKTCMESILFGAAIGAERARQMGFINAVCETEDIVTAALETIAPLLEKNLDAFAMCKRYYNDSDHLDYPRQLELGKYLLVSMLKLK